MSGFIRMMACEVSHSGTCNKCETPRDGGDHRKCDRWPQTFGSDKGFHYVANSKESTLAELKKIVEAICAGDDDRTPVRFDIRIMQTANVPDEVEVSA